LILPDVNVLACALCCVDAKAIVNPVRHAGHTALAIEADSE